MGGKQCHLRKLRRMENGQSVKVSMMRGEFIVTDIDQNLFSKFKTEEAEKKHLDALEFLHLDLKIPINCMWIAALIVSCESSESVRSRGRVTVDGVHTSVQ